jgi:WD40 repeat protein
MNVSKILALLFTISLLYSQPIFSTSSRVGDVNFPVIAWSPDGEWLAIARDRSVLVFNTTSQTQGKEFVSNGNISRLTWHPGNELLAGITPNSGDIHIWNIETGSEFTTLSGPATLDTFASVAWSQDGTLLAAGALQSDANLPLIIWSFDGQNFRAMPVTFETTVYDLQWNSLQNELGIATQWGITIIDDFTSSSSNTRSLSGFYLNFAWSPDGSRIAAANRDRLVDVIDVASGVRQAQLDPPISSTEGIAALGWSSDSQRITAVTFDGSTETWDLSTRFSVSNSNLSEVTIGRNAAAWSPFAGRIALAGITDSIHDSSSSAQLPPFTILVPDPSIERLNAIAAACDAPVSLTQSLTDTAPVMADVIAQVEALPADSIPPACAADLLAVARALEGQAG